MSEIQIPASPPPDPSKGLSHRPSVLPKRYQHETEKSNHSEQLLGLSLFMMLLAFFIVLTAKGGFEPKKFDPILQSIDKAFSTPTDDLTHIFPSLIPHATHSTGDGYSQKAIDQWLNAIIAGTDPAPYFQNGIFKIELDKKPFDRAVQYNQIIELGGSAENPVKMGSFSLFKALASLNMLNDRGMPYGVRLLMRTDNNQINDQIETTQLAAYAAEFIRQGVPESLISIGFHHEKSPIILIFEPIPFDDKSNPTPTKNKLGNDGL
jgi:hypothetical protein